MKYIWRLLRNDSEYYVDKLAGSDESVKGFAYLHVYRKAFTKGEIDMLEFLLEELNPNVKGISTGMSVRLRNNLLLN